MVFSNSNIYLCKGNELILANMITGNVDIYCDVAQKKLLHALECDSPYLLGSSVEYFSKRGYVFEDKQQEEEAILNLKDNLNESRDELSIVIMPTEQCNFRCIYCCEPHNPHILSEADQDRIIAFIQEVLPGFKKLHIEWFGGEPLLELEIIERISRRIIDICKSLGIIYYASCSTNGYGLSFENFLRMLNCRVLFYQITIDGMERTHNAQRPLANMSGTWKRIVDNLIEIHERANSQLFSIALRTNVTTEIEKNLPNYIKYMQSIFGNDKRFHFYIRKAENWGNITDDNLGKLCGDTDFIHMLSAIDLHDLRIHMHRRTLLPTERLCRTTAKNSFVIFSDGRVTKCSRDIAGHKNGLGTLEDICRNPKSALNKSIFEIHDHSCLRCENYYICLGLTCPFERDMCQNYRSRLLSTLGILLQMDTSINRIYSI